MGVDAGAWLALLGAAGCAALAWKAAARARRSRLRRAGRGPAWACPRCASMRGTRSTGDGLNELGRYYDPVDQVVYTDAGFVWIVPALAFLAAGLLCARRV